MLTKVRVVRASSNDWYSNYVGHVFEVFYPHSWVHGAGDVYMLSDMSGVIKAEDCKEEQDVGSHVVTVVTVS